MKSNTQDFDGKKSRSSFFAVKLRMAQREIMDFECAPFSIMKKFSFSAHQLIKIHQRYNEECKTKSKRKKNASMRMPICHFCFG